MCSKAVRGFRVPDRELFTGLDVYVDALNAINASQGWARRINDDVRKENIHGEFRFPSPKCHVS